MTEIPDDLKNIPVWSGNKTERSFVFSDSVTGESIPVTRIERWDDFFELVDSKPFDQVGTDLIFRGQRRYDWQLSPTLGRAPYSKDGNVTKEKAKKMYDLFSQAVRGRLNDWSLVDESTQEELLAVGQHYGLKTPLLDWTHSPYVALFFAFNEQDPFYEGLENYEGLEKYEGLKNYYRAIYALNKSFVEKECKGITVLEPKRDDHGRLVNQAGLFTVCYDATIEHQLLASLKDKDGNFSKEELASADYDSLPELLAAYNCKIYIKNESRSGIIKHLRKMNVHHASLFPDLIGASDYCNLIMAEWSETQENKQPFANKEPKIESTGVASKPTPKLDVSEQDIATIEEMLHLPISDGQMESGRVSVLAKDLAIGLQPDEVAFYDALANNESAVRELGDEILKKIAVEITEKLRKSTTVDWQVRESVRAKLRILVRRTLQRYKYPPDKAADAIELILKQAEVLSNAWTN